jgi:hypothetical protein
MRTERVTLEVTHDLDARLSDWIVEVVDESLGIMESVRVVDDETSSDADAEVLRRACVASEIQRLKADAEVDRLRKELEAASVGNRPETPVSSPQAASGGGEGKPVAWGCATPDGRLVHVSTFKPERDTATIVPLYRQPPQPRGWLSEDEREAVQWAADAAYDKQHPAEITLRSVLLRSSPPEVVLPENPYHPSGLREGFEHAIRIVRNELVNAGVAVKEVQ